MTTKQLEANRANAQKSTGPRTDAGKYRSRLNAVRHGCTAQTLIFVGDDAHHFARLIESLKESFAPANAHELSLVETLAQHQLAINRTRAIETNLFALGHEKFAGAIDTGGDEVIQAALAATQTFKAETESLKVLSLYMQRNARMYESTLKQLITVQATRKAAELEQLDEAVEIAQTLAKSNTPFQLAEFGFDFSPTRFALHLRRKTATGPRPNDTPRLARVVN